MDEVDGRRSPLRRRRGPLRRRAPSDPYAGLPVAADASPLLPRWFVLLLLAAVPVAVVLFVLAFFGLAAGGGDDVAGRRPPPDARATAAVGEVTVGPRAAAPGPAACPEAGSLWPAGVPADRRALARTINALCALPDAAAALADLAADGPVTVRFAGFADNRVDVTGIAPGGAGPATVWLNARLSGSEPVRLAPLLAYQARLATAARVDAGAVLDARALERAVCDALLDEPTPSCRDAADLLALDDPVAALEAAGFDGAAAR